MVRLLGQRQPQHLAGLSFVVLLHILIVYAFLNGLAPHRASDAPLPLEVRMVAAQQQKPEQVPDFSSVLEKAPHFTVSPPIVNFDSNTSLDPLTPPTIIGLPPREPPLVAVDGRGLHSNAPAVVTGTAIGTNRVSTEGNCSNATSLASSIVYPARARRLGIQQGQVSVEFSVAGDGTLAIDGVTASNAVFESAALDAVRTLHCSAGRYRLPISFVLQD